MKTHQNRYLCVMLRIITHTERLLAMHDCVIIPGWGGFVLQTVSATYKKEEHAFAPMRKEVVFNAALQYTDGLLTASYMQAYEVDFRKAQTMVESDVEEMKASLTRFSKLSFGSIGSFSSGETGQAIFQPGKADFFGMDYYGLATFHYPVLPPVVVEEEKSTGKQKQKADIFYIPVNRRIVRGIVASAAAVALFLLISTPVKDVNQAAYTASFVPTERTISTQETVLVDEAEGDEAATEDLIIENLLEEEITDDIVIAEPVAQVKSKMYYVVIGSFPTEALANVFIADISQKEFSQLFIVEREGRYRVHTGAFENSEEAESQLAVVRQNEAYQSAWLFTSR